MKKEGDLRSQRTRIFIQNALIELTQKRGFEAISVEDISRQAMINRTTFYKHYRDKYQLVEEMFKETLSKMAVDAGPPREFHGVADLSAAPKKKDEDERFQAAWVKLFEHFASNSRLYATMLSGKGSAWFQTRMREHMTKFFKERLKLHGKPLKAKAAAVPAEVAQVLFANAIVGIIVWWLEGGMKYSSEQIAAWFRRIARQGYVGAIAGIDG